MSARTFRHGVTRLSTWSLFLIGGGLLAAGVSTTAGLIFIGLGALNVLRITFKRGLPEKLALADEKKRRGIDRRIKATERRELDRIGAYCDRLRESTLDPSLAEQTWDRAWEIIRGARAMDGTQELASFREGLPSLDDGPDAVAQKIQRDMDRRRAIEAELEL